MTDFPYFRSSLARKVEASSPGSPFSPGEQANPEAGRYCAYSETRQRFLCANIEAADFSAASLDARLSGLTPNSGAGLWIVPIHNIPATSVRVPLDLMYLDRNSVVLDAVESFPFSQSTASIGSATSILALPAQTISSSGTLPGDQLTLCTPEEMKARLQRMSEPNSETGSALSPAFGQNASSVNDWPSQKVAGNLILFVDRSRASSDRVLAPPEIQTVAAPTVPPPAVAPASSQPDQAPAPRWKATPSKSWLMRLLLSEPSDPRKALRAALPWLVAYFFTGGRPVAHGIRDISATGMYVFTEERWYPGTVVRITLTDQRNPTAERSFTVNAEVIRSTDNGVGFQFVLKDGRDPRHASASGVDRQAQGVYRAEVEEFLLRICSGAN